MENDRGYIPVVAGARSAVIVPLSSGAALIGLIAMESEQLNAYNNDTLTLLRTLSGTLSRHHPKSAAARTSAEDDESAA